MDKSIFIDGDFARITRLLMCQALDVYKALVDKYSGDQPKEEKQKEITGCMNAYIIAIDVEHITGKEAIEYVNSKM